MPQTVKKILAIFLVVVVVLSAMFLLRPKNVLTVTKSANGSSGKFWKYQLSRDNIIREIDYHSGPMGHKQYWKFQSVNDGEVTIDWMAYEFGDYVESKSYSVTYSVDDGIITKVN